MPNYIQFTKKGEKEPITLVDLDNEMCTKFEIEAHPTYYSSLYRGKLGVGGLGWFDTIGFLLAIGNTFDEIRKSWKDHSIGHDEPDFIGYKILDYMEENFLVRAWAER